MIVVDQGASLNLTCDTESDSYLWVQTYLKTDAYDLGFDGRVTLNTETRTVHFTYVVPSDEEYYACVNAQNLAPYNSYLVYVRSK